MTTRASAIATFLLAACGPRVPIDTGGTDGGTDGRGEHGTGTGTTLPGTTSSADDSADVDPTRHLDFYPDDPPPTRAIDVLFVIDNSSHMADIQLWLGQAMGDFVAQLADGQRDVQVMFTTTDVGNPLCTPFQKPDYQPAMGAPIATGCNARINRFTGLDPNDPEIRTEVCTSLCPSDIVPGDPFIAFDTVSGANNVGDADIAAALACVLPQGIDGCGFESPLEAMALALAPTADWNTGDRPFLRAEADLAIVIVTDEADCSLADVSVMEDPASFNVNPHSDSPQPSSGICWNVGVTCVGPDADGIYSDCVPAVGPMHPVARYTDMLASLGKRVTMVALAGVPEVTEHNSFPPYEPIAGGLGELVYRDWRDTDLFAEETKSGVDAADLTWEYTIGPACAADQNGTRLARAVPNPRLFEVCQSLDEPDDPRCCIESVCGDPRIGLICAITATLPPGGTLDGGLESG